MMLNNQETMQLAVLATSCAAVVKATTSVSITTGSEMLYGVTHMVKDHSGSDTGTPLPWATLSD